MKNSDLALALIVLAMTSALVDTAYAQDAAPAIAANGSQVTTHITQIVDLSLTVEIEAGSSVGENGDWWLVAETPSGWYSYDIHDRAWKPGFFVSYQGPLIDLPSFGVSSLTGLPIGTYTFYFGVDLLMNGSLDTGRLFYRSVAVHVDDIWQPAPGAHWQWQLSGTIDTSFVTQMYDIDLFEVAPGVIDQLHADGRVVICYFSAGSWEDWRPDAATFPAAVRGEPLEDFPDETWLDIRQLDGLGPIMRARLDLAVEKGCDGVEPDNVDGYVNETGFGLTAQDQLNYNLWLSVEAHARGLSVGLKNDLDQVADLVPFFDWALNEQCFQFNECASLLPFVEAGKAVFGVEYEGNPETFCPEANVLGYSWLQKRLELDAWRFDCSDN